MGYFTDAKTRGKLKMQKQQSHSVKPSTANSKITQKANDGNQRGVCQRQRIAKHERYINVICNAERQHHVANTQDIKAPFPSILDDVEDDKQLEYFEKNNFIIGGKYVSIE